MNAILFCDGASRGNPGPASFGYAVFEESRLIAKGGKRLGQTTNNVAEYQALVHGLERCASLGIETLLVKSDSQLLIRQLNGQYKVKAPQIIPLFQKAQILRKKFKKVSFVHVPREENSVADAIANEVLDGTFSEM